jgi:hypothetical protein
MDNSIIFGTLIGSLVGCMVLFVVVESAVVNALKRFKKWEAKENEKTN